MKVILTVTNIFTEHRQLDSSEGKVAELAQWRENNTHVRTHGAEAEKHDARAQSVQ